MTIHHGLTRCAGIYCNDPTFHAWLEENARLDPGSIGREEATFVVRKACGIQSRRELDTNQDAAETFLEFIRKPYLAWRDQQQQNRRAA